MCQFFSAIATKDGRLLFTENDSHEEIIERAQLRDTELYLRHWVRIEQRPGTHMRVDETSTPTWFTEERDMWQARAEDCSAQLLPARLVRDEAYAAAGKVSGEACAAAWKVFDEACAAARKVSGEAYAPARKVFDEACAAAMKAYDEACAAAWKVYITQLTMVEGYLPKRQS